MQSVIRGYHEYKDICDAAIDGLPCEREPGNLHDPSTVAMVKQSSDTSVAIGHFPQLISMVCYIFICRGGCMMCIVTGLQKYSEDLPQGGKA